MTGFKFSVLFAILLLVLVVSCSQDTANPAVGWTPDTTGNNQSATWELVGEVSDNGGVLIARNTSNTPGDTIFASATLKTPKDFGQTNGVTYTWQETVTGEATYRFYSGTDTSRMNQVQVRDNETGGKKAQIQFLLDLSGPLYARFTFVLPPSSSIQVAGYSSRADL